MAPRSIWIPGSDHGLVWSGGVALLDGSVTPEVVERMWLQLHAGADLPGFLEGLSEACGSGLLGLPGFAIGLVGDQRMHLAVRGDFCATVSDGVEQTRIEGTGVATWTERLIPGGHEISVSRLGLAPAPGMILVGGIVPAGMVLWRCIPSPPQEAAAPSAREPVASEQPTARRPREDERPATATPTPAVGSPAPVKTGQAAAAPKNGVTESGETEGATGSRFDVLWGKTMAHSVEEAAVRVAEDDDPMPSPVPPHGGDGLIDAVPRHYPPPPAIPAPRPQPQLPGAGVAGDHDGETVAREELGRVVPATGSSDTGLVLAALCPEQHPNPPASSECRICGRAVATAAARLPQPSIGRLHTSTGESLDLSGPVIVGRNPRASRFQGVQIPRLLSLPFAHISGSHLELRPEGWSLLAVDLNSTNGTFLRRGSDPPKRIPDTPTPLYAGDVLDFGDDVKITFEFIP